MMPPAAAATAGRVMTVTEYRASLLQARSLAIAAQREKGLPASAVTAARASIEAALPLQAEVRLPSGATVSVDNRPVARLLTEPFFGERRGMGGFRRPRAGSPPWRRPPRASLRLWRFVTAVDQLLAATAVSMPSIDRVGADRVLRQVLARSEYQYKQRKPSIVSWFFSWLGDQFMHFFLWLARLLDRWLPASGSTPGRADRLAQLMVIGVVLLLAVLIARMLLVILPNLRRLRGAEDAEPAGGELMVPREPQALLAEAEREAAAGRYREALRLAYLATVARLDRAGVLPEDRSRTHWELLRDLRRTTRNEERGGGAASWPRSGQRRGPGPGRNETVPTDSSVIPHPSSLVSILAPLTQRLDERIYGGRATTIEDYQACRAAHDQIERLLCAPA